MTRTRTGSWVHGLDRSNGLDLTLHGPGGGVETTEAAIHHLRAMFKECIRAIAPQFAMSGGTVIACASKETVPISLTPPALEKRILSVVYGNGPHPYRPASRSGAATSCDFRFSRTIRHFQASCVDASMRARSSGGALRRSALTSPRLWTPSTNMRS